MVDEEELFIFYYILRTFLNRNSLAGNFQRLIRIWLIVYLSYWNIAEGDIDSGECLLY